jgi:hypothetical protein
VDKIIEAISKVWENQYGKGKAKANRHHVGGFMCWDWAEIFKEETDKQKLSLWESSYRGYFNKAEAKKAKNPDDEVTLHIVLVIKLSKPEPQSPTTKCDGFTFDDGFLSNGYTHGTACKPDHWTNQEYSEFQKEPTQEFIDKLQEGVTGR